MKYVFIVIKRELIAYKNSLIINSFSLVLLPVFLFLLLAMPLYRLIPSVNQLNYLYWVTPGIWLITASYSAFTAGYTEIRKIRFENNMLDLYLKSPVSIWKVQSGLVLWAFILGLVQYFAAIIMISTITNEIIVLDKMILLSLQIIPVIFFSAVAGNTLGSWLKSSEFQVIITMILFLFFALGSGGFIPLENFPDSYAATLKSIPIIDCITRAHSIMLHHEGSPGAGITTLIIGLITFLINGALSSTLFRKK
ncbi:MAG: hypothetical protein GXO91_08260 [FCB group bacterium]|nr:hypothetical protein [FCB group bacterium]